MVLKIEQSESIKDKVTYKDVHGKFPYKLYLEVKGNCKYGRYIVVVGNEQYYEVDKIKIKVKGATEQRENTIFNKDKFNSFFVKEVDIFAIGDKPINVFNVIGIQNN